MSYSLEANLKNLTIIHLHRYSISTYSPIEIVYKLAIFSLALSLPVSLLLLINEAKFLPPSKSDGRSMLVPQFVDSPAHLLAKILSSAN